MSEFSNGTRATSLNDLPPGRAILTIRIIWAALILGQLAFMGVEALILSQPPQAGGRDQAAPASPTVFLIINAAMLLTIVPGAFMFRMLRLRQARRENGTVPAAVYSTVNIIFWAACEGVSFFGLVAALLVRSFWPTIVFVVAAIAMQVLTFPRRSAIEGT